MEDPADGFSAVSKELSGASMLNFVQYQLICNYHVQHKGSTWKTWQGNGWTDQKCILQRTKA